MPIKCHQLSAVTAMHLLGAEITRQLTDNWLMHARTQQTATRLTKRWLNRLENGTLGQNGWSGPLITPITSQDVATPAPPMVM